MKKLFVVLTLLCLTAVNTFAVEEVRGVETKIVTYDGDSYSYYNSTHTEYDGFEFTNLNSIPVSVAVEVYYRDDRGDRLIFTKDFVLKSKESYIVKHPHKYVWRAYESSSNVYYDIRTYYVKYKAYKVL